MTDHAEKRPQPLESVTSETAPELPSDEDVVSWSEPQSRAYNGILRKPLLTMST